MAGFRVQISGSFDKIYKDNLKLKKRLEETFDVNLMTYLVEFGVESAKKHLLESGHIDTYATYDSIHGYMTDKGMGVIEASGAAIWLEFGTGVKHTGYSEELPENIVSHGQYGENLGANPKGWHYENVETQNSGWTTGVNAVEFMLHARKDIEDEVKRIGGDIVSTLLQARPYSKWV